MGKSLNIAVVGCGVAGTAVSLLLARGGHRVTLFEQSPQVGPVGAGILLQPSGQAVLRKMGLLEDVIRGAEPIGELHARVHRGGDLVRLRYGDLSPGLTGYGLHRGDLFTVLHRAIGEAGVDLRLNQTVTGYEQDATGAWLVHTPRRTSRMGTPDREENPRLPSRRLERYDLLVAADGSRSRLRTASGIPHWVWPYAHGAFWAIGRCPAVRGQLLQVAHGTRELCGMVPMGGGRCSLFWGVACADVDRIRAGGFAAWRETVLDRQPLAAELFEGIDRFEQVRFVTYQHVQMSRWHQGRVVFIGDAAHAMSPQLGQGVNLALADAWELAQSLNGGPPASAGGLAPPAETGRPLGPALALYEKRRRRQLIAYSWTSFALAPFFQSNVDLLATGRNLALPWFPRLPPMYRLMLRALAGVLGHSRRMALARFLCTTGGDVEESGDADPAMSTTRRRKTPVFD